MSRVHELDVRVRYAETDKMGVVYHAHYFLYFEMGRTEFMRTAGLTYRELEERGYLLVVVEATARYHANVGYDESIRVRTRVGEVGRVRIRFDYEALAGERLLAEGSTTLACVDAKGKVRALPEDVTRLLREAAPSAAGGTCGAP